MRKLLLGTVGAFALVLSAAPAFASDYRPSYPQHYNPGHDKVVCNYWGGCYVKEDARHDGKHRDVPYAQPKTVYSKY